MPQLHSSPPDRPEHLVNLGRLTLEGSAFERTKPLLLLTYLCLEGPKARRHLAELFWPRAANALASLSTELSRLKKRLGDVLEADDLNVYPRLRSDARAFLDAVDGKDFLRATELYTGGFLPDVSVQEGSVELGEWLESTRAFLAARACDALLSLGEQVAREGRFDEAARRAETAASEPLVAALDTERLRRAYALLAAAEHPRTAALRRRGEALGLAFDVFDLTPEGARRRLRPQSRLNLPTYGTSFVGRSAELGAVTDLLRGEARLVTVVGPAGIGKSRFAVEVARALQAEGSFPDGLYPVWLVALTKAEEVPSSLASALGLELKGPDVLGQTSQKLADQSSLLYFDNFEHVIKSAPFLSALLTRCPNLKILVTSRERLNLEEEWVVWLGGLGFSARAGPSEAEALFVARAKRADVSFGASGKTPEAVTDICRLVEGSPLALELAASWVRVMDCGEICERLRGSLDVLSTRLRNVPERHRSIEAAFEHSWRLLNGEERRVLRELSVFRGGFSREAAQEVVGAGLSVLASLVDKSLLVMREGGRFGRHPLLYDYTRRRQAEHGELDALKGRHAAYYRAFLEGCAPQSQGPGSQAVLGSIEQEFSNIQLAWADWLARAQGDAVAAVLPALWRYFDFSGRSQEGNLMLASASERFAALGAHAELRASLLLRQAQLLYRLSRFEPALQAAKESLALSRSDTQRAAALSALGTVYRVLRRSDEARGAYQQALSLLGPSLDPSLRAKLLTNLASLEAAPDVGNVERAAQLYEESLALKRTLGDDAMTARTLYNYASLLQKRGQPEAERTVRECLSKCLSAGYRPLEPYAQNLLGKALARRGEQGEGRRSLRRALQGAENTKDRYLISAIMVNLAYLGATTRADQAVKLLGAAYALRQPLGISLEGDEDYRQVADLAHTALPTPEFDAAWREGQLLTLAEALHLARDT